MRDEAEKTTTKPRGLKKEKKEEVEETDTSAPLSAGKTEETEEAADTSSSNSSASLDSSDSSQKPDSASKSKHSTKGKKKKKKEEEEDGEEGEQKEPRRFRLFRRTKERPPVKRKALAAHSFLASINNIGMGKQSSLFVQSTSTMLEAGLPLIDTLKIFQEETHARAMRKLIQRMIDEIENGIPFWQAMKNQRLFSPYDIAMVRIGEEAGNLARNMVYLAEQKEKDRQLKQKVKMAMIYPAIVLVMMFIIIMGLGLFVLPNLVQVLFALNAELPFTTKVVIWISQMFSEHGAVFVPLLVVFIILFFLLAKFTRFKTVAQWLVFHFPGIGRLAREATIARFGVILGGLLQAGVPFVAALESLIEVTQVTAYKKFYAQLLEHVRIGDSFSKGFAELRESKKLLPVSVQQLVVTGERSGSLSESLLKVASIYEKKASETAQVLPVILEPVLLLIIGGLVAFIAFAIIVPIYSVVGNIGSA